MALGRTLPHHWTPEQVDVAEALAAQASVALERARLYVEAREAYKGLKDAQTRIIQAEKLAMVGTFASGLAHEVRNPLNSMALQLSLLERRIAPLEAKVADAMRDLTGIIREEIKRLDSLVGDFLLFSRTNRVQFRPTSLDALLDEVVRLLRPEARASNITLRRQRLGSDLPDVPMDAEKMKQVAINLIRNAIEAMPEFQLFVTTKPSGTGLGLSIAQQIILEHAGEISASSDPGKGATFTISLPLTARPLEGDRA
jgi:signal transduction histidine kinase